MPARHRQAMRTMARFAAGPDGPLRVGIPLEFPFDVLRPALTRLADQWPETKVQVRHLSTADQLAALADGWLELALVRERPGGGRFDTMLVMREELGVLLPMDLAERLTGRTVCHWTRSATWSGWPSRAPAARSGTTS